MTEMAESVPPLPRDLVQEVLEVSSVGERVRRLRRHRGFKTQTAFLNAIAATYGAAPSKAWLSGIESDSLPLTKARSEQMAFVLGLAGDEQVLLSPDVDAVPASDSMKRYAAWQAVRLALADEMLRGRRGQERVRGENVRDRLSDALEANDEILRAANKRVDRLDQFADSLPEAARWMLLVEAAFMDPFTPFDPFEFDFDQSRTDILEELAGQLDLAEARPVIKECIEGSRRIPKPSSTYLTDKEPKPYERDPAGLSRAALAKADPEGDYALLCGGSLVGALGWGFAAGAFLVSHPLQYRGTGQGGFETWGPLPSAAVPMRAIITPGPWSEPARRPATDPDGTGLNAIEFLAGLGERALNNELAKLKAATLLRGQSRALEDGFTGEGIPSASIASARLGDLRLAIEEAIKVRLEFDRSGAADVKAMRRMVRFIKDSAKALVQDERSLRHGAS